MKYLNIILTLSVLLLTASLSYSQNVTIDYQSWNPSSPPCNVFAGGVNVPATVGGSSSAVNHGSLYGQPQYNTSSSVKAVELPVNYVNSSDTRGTQYRLAYSFKANYSYQIDVNAAEKTSTQGSGNNLYLRLALSNSSGSTNPPCNGPENRTRDVSGNDVAQMTNGTAFKDYTLTYNPTSAFSSLDVSAYSAVSGGSNAVRIRKIIITELLLQHLYLLFHLPLISNADLHPL